MTARIPGTDEAAGLLMEHSFLPVYMGMPTAGEAEQLEAFADAQTTYASNGYTTVQDAPMEPATRPLYHKAAEQGRFFFDVVGFVNWLEFAGTRQDERRAVQGAATKSTSASAA